MKTLDSADATNCKRFLKEMYNVIALYLYAFSMPMDPVVQKSRYVDIIEFWDDLPILVVAQAALKRDLESI